MDKFKALGRVDFLFPLFVLTVLSGGLIYVFYNIGYSKGVDVGRGNDSLIATSPGPLDGTEGMNSKEKSLYSVLYERTRPDFDIPSFEQIHSASILMGSNLVKSMDFTSDYMTPVEHRFRLSSDYTKVYYISEDNSSLVMLGSNGSESIVYEVDEELAYISSFSLDSEDNWFVLAHSDVPNFENSEEVVTTMLWSDGQLEVNQPYLLRGISAEGFVFQRNFSEAPAGGGMATVIYTDKDLNVLDLEIDNNWILTGNGESLLFSKICDMYCEHDLLRLNLLTMEVETFEGDLFSTQLVSLLPGFISILNEVEHPNRESSGWEFLMYPTYKSYEF